MRVKTYVVILVAALAAGFYLGTPAPVASGQIRTVPDAELVTFTWPRPTTTPVRKRVIEVVDQIGPAKWRVSQAAEWLDRYTASNMVTVSRCSGRAWRCITVRGGRLPGNVLALTKGSTITVDTAKVDRHGWRSNLSREKILAHELAHAFGITKHTRRTLMAASMPGTRLYLNAGQRRFLASR